MIFGAPFLKKTKQASLSVLCGTSLLLSLNIAHAESEKGAIEKCERNLGTLAVAEPQSQILASLTQYRLGSPSAMLRLIVQESGCFTIVERGVAMQNLQQERALAAGGQLQEGSNVGGGQLQAADFVMTPVVQFSGDTGGVGGAVGSLFGHIRGPLGVLGGLAGGVKFKEAETTLLVADVRSGIQVASAEGKASKMNFSIGGWGWGGMGWASAGGYSKTPEGKLIAASLLDNFNKIAIAVRDKPMLIQSTSVSSQKNAASSIQATGTTRKIANAVSPPPLANAPSRLSGIYIVKFSGDDQGTVNVVIANSGKISGMGVSDKYKNSFTVMGSTTPDGEMSLDGKGTAGASKFNGNIDLNTGEVVGIWQTVGDSTAQGTFSGERKQKRTQ